MHRAGTSFVHRIFRVARWKKIGVGWKQWRRADVFWMQQFAKRKSALRHCLKGYMGKLIRWTLMQLRVATGVGFWSKTNSKLVPDENDANRDDSSSDGMSHGEDLSHHGGGGGDGDGDVDDVDDDHDDAERKRLLKEIVDGGEESGAEQPRKWVGFGTGGPTPEGLYAIKVRVEYARLHQINAQQWAKQMEFLHAFSSRLASAANPPAVIDLVAELAPEGLKTVPRIVQAEHEQKVMQHIGAASRVAVRSSSPRGSGQGGALTAEGENNLGPVIVIMVHLPAGTKVIVKINGEDRDLQASIEKTLAGLESVETLRVPGIVCPSSAHVITMRRGDPGKSYRDEIRGSKRFNIFHCDAVLELILSLVRRDVSTGRP